MTLLPTLISVTAYNVITVVNSVILDSLPRLSRYKKHTAEDVTLNESKLGPLSAQCANESREQSLHEI